jgi:hypothetical protein
LIPSTVCTVALIHNDRISEAVAINSLITLFFCKGATMENASQIGGIVMQKKTVNRARMKRTVWRNVHAHVDQMNSHVPLAVAYWYDS